MVRKKVLCPQISPFPVLLLAIVYLRNGGKNNDGSKNKMKVNLKRDHTGRKVP